MSRSTGLLVSGTRWALACLACTLAYAAPTAGQAADVVFEAQSTALFEGWYVVRPGDTLRGITARYLGDQGRWQENWRLNPTVADPDRLEPGQRLRILFRTLPEDGALLSKVSNQVEGQLPPLPWEQARLFELLRSRDGLRTHKRSSAALLFSDNTRLTISEESLVFLERLKVAEEPPRDQIEIQVGQADFEGKSVKAARGDIDIVIGGVRAAPKPGPQGEVRTRARRADAGSAQLMVYEGASELAAGGRKVEVPRGMGSVTEAGQAPGDPEKLLDAPVLNEPRGDVAVPRPTFAWQAVSGAAGYTFELCADATCARLLERVVGTDALTWRPATKMPIAGYFWRATAVAPSGLDGYPAEAAAFAVTSDVEDSESPLVRLKVDGPHLPPRFGMNPHYILGKEARLTALAADDQGPPTLTCTLDGVATADERWRGPWEPGAKHAAACVAVDSGGNRGELPPFEFVYDVEPPELTWGVEGRGALGKLALAPHADLARQPARQRLEVDDPRSLWPWNRLVWTIEHDSRQLVLRPSRQVKLALGDEVVELGPDHALWVIASDKECESLSTFDYQVEIEEQGSFFRKRLEGRLRLEAIDWVDNGAIGEARFTSQR